MKSDSFDKTLRRHMGLFGAASPNQIEVSRARIRERLASGESPALDNPPAVGRAWMAPRQLWALASAAVLIVAVATVRWSSDDVIRAGEAGRMLTLDDGSRVEMRAMSELSVARAADVIDIRLLAGDIIVNAAKQRDGHLYVHTNDMRIAVVGTVFLVNAGRDGSRVAVIEGEVRVLEGDVEKTLRPGEQTATSPTIARRAVKADLAWSRNAGAHIAQLDTFMKGMAQTAGALEPVGPPPGQSAAAGGGAGGPEFEEASIRECDPDNLPPSVIGARGGGANSVMTTLGRYYALCVTPATLIRVAYGYRAVNVEALLPDGLPRGGRAPLRGRSGVVGSLGQEDGSRIRGGPDWVRTQQFTIEAVADNGADSATMSGPMLRALLERRFKLKTHVETEQTLAYNLVVAPGGLKINPVPAGSCEIPPAEGAPQARVRLSDGTVRTTGVLVNGMPLPKPRPLTELRRAARPSCAELEGPNGPNWVMLAGEATFAELTQFLRARLGNGIGITDQTGISDKFNWDLEYLVDANVGPGSPSGIIPDTDANVPRAPTIFDALEQQLGLRLQPVQVPREYLVIDAIERPAPN